MTASRLVLAVSVGAAALALAGCGGGSNNSAATTTTGTTASVTTTAATTTTATIASGSTLTATVGPGFTISLTGPDGNAVKTLKAGKYTIDVDDESSSHNFHLAGAGVDKTTDIGGTGKQTWTVQLKKGAYHFQCDPHASTMNGDFTVAS
jgi:hypothetical protein